MSGINPLDSLLCSVKDIFTHSHISENDLNVAINKVPIYSILPNMTRDNIDFRMVSFLKSLKEADAYLKKVKYAESFVDFLNKDIQFIIRSCHMCQDWIKSTDYSEYDKLTISSNLLTIEDIVASFIDVEPSMFMLHELEETYLNEWDFIETPFDLLDFYTLWNNDCECEREFIDGINSELSNNKFSEAFSRLQRLIG